MSKFSILGLFIAIAMMFTIGCSDDDDNGDLSNVNCGTSWLVAEAFQDALSNYTDANSAYLSNPTSENCNAFIDATNDFIDVLESFRSCAVDQGLLDEWEQNFDNARDSIEDFEC